MPTYNYECYNCEDVTEVTCSISELNSQSLKCRVCPNGTLRKVILSAPTMVIPGNMAHDGIHKVVGTPNRHQKPIIPLQFTEDLPDGRTKITTLET